MKKTYQQPLVAIQRLQTLTMLCASEIRSTNIGGLGTGGSTGEGGITEGGARHFSIWDDDDEE